MIHIYIYKKAEVQRAQAMGRDLTRFDGETERSYVASVYTTRHKLALLCAIKFLLVNMYR